MRILGEAVDVTGSYGETYTNYDNKFQIDTGTSNPYILGSSGEGLMGELDGENVVQDGTNIRLKIASGGEGIYEVHLSAAAETSGGPQTPEFTVKIAVNGTPDCKISNVTDYNGSAVYGSGTAVSGLYELEANDIVALAIQTLDPWQFYVMNYHLWIRRIARK